MVAAGDDGGRPAERAYADSMTGDYPNAVAATLSERQRHCRRHCDHPARGASVPARLTGCVAVVTIANAELAEPGPAPNAAGCAGALRSRAGR
jgi:hypothetical protein